MHKVMKNIPLNEEVVRIEKEFTLDLSQGTFVDKEDFAKLVMKFLGDIPEDAWVEIKPAPFTAFWSRLVKEVGIPDDKGLEDDWEPTTSG